MCGTFSVDLGLQFVMYMDWYNEALASVHCTVHVAVTITKTLHMIQ